MTLIPPTRKRNRSCGEEDFLPLSKKINNLHINNWGSVENQQDQIITWSNRTDHWIASQHSLINQNRSEDESLDSSPFESAEKSAFHNAVNKTEGYKSVKKDSYHGSGSQQNFENKMEEERQNSWPMVYNPDLNIDENPYYYESNKLLFELYVARLQRVGY